MKPVLLFSAFAIFSTNVRGTLAQIALQLPLESVLVAGTAISEPLASAIKSLAAANMIIAVRFPRTLSLSFPLT